MKYPRESFSINLINSAKLPNPINKNYSHKILPMFSPLLPPSIKTLSIVHYHSTHTILLSNLISNKSSTKYKKPKISPYLLQKNNHHNNKYPNPYSKPPHKNPGHHQPKNHTKKNHPLLKKITLQEYLEFLVKFLAVKNNKNLKHTK